MITIFKSFLKLVLLLLLLSSGAYNNCYGQVKEIELYADSLKKIGLFNEASLVYEKILKQYKILKEPDSSVFAKVYNDLGECQYYLGNFEQALPYYSFNLVIYKQINDSAKIAESLGNMGAIYSEFGEFNKAYNLLIEALQIDRELNDSASSAFELNNIGYINKCWGKYNDAFDCYQQAYIINSYQRDTMNMATNLINIGSLYATLNMPERAIIQFGQALELYQLLKMEIYVALTNNNIGGVYYQLHDYEKAIQFFFEGLSVYTKLKNNAEVANINNNIAAAYGNLKEHRKALYYYDIALNHNKKYNKTASVADNYFNIGQVYINLNNYDSAICSYLKAIELYEILRNNTPGEIKRDYLSSQIGVYDRLAFCYYKRNEPLKAWETVEMCRAKYFVEQLSNANSVKIPELKLQQQAISDSSAIVLFASFNSDEPLQFFITKDSIKIRPFRKKELIDTVLYYFQDDMERFVSRGFQNDQETNNDTKNKTDSTLSIETTILKIDNFETIIKYYRYLLLNGYRDPASIANTKHLSKILYKYLLSRGIKDISEKKELIIIPDGILGYLPFEALQDENDKFLIQRFDVRYIQSLSIHELIKQRIYSAARKPLLAFGGAVYNEISYEEDMRNSIKPKPSNTETTKGGELYMLNASKMKRLRKKIEQANLANTSYRDVYKILFGDASWANLQGSLLEVEAIAKLAPNSEIVTGKEVSEQNIKSLSASGDLANYKVLHFSTHGFVIPEMPELSALVLSQQNDSLSEDGYLRMPEIAKLRLNADFVNLSACETGLGKIYAGEGIVGLTQSFMLAGANGIAVSLWPIADYPTAIFMVELYKLIYEKNYTYSHAISEIKRQFIKGEINSSWKSPYIWAPFVYYGK